jgi:hypothetical protein
MQSLLLTKGIIVSALLEVLDNHLSPIVSARIILLE